MEDTAKLECPICGSGRISRIGFAKPGASPEGTNNISLVAVTSDGRDVVLPLRAMGCDVCGYVLLFSTATRQIQTLRGQPDIPGI